MAKKITFAVIGIIIGLLILVFATLALHPTFAMHQPAYKDAQAICDSIKVGMTYAELKNKFGNSFTPGPSTYVENRGNGQVWLTNEVKGLETNCHIELTNGRVVSSGMAYVWL